MTVTKVYGKRSRALYDRIDFSSPEQTSTKPVLVEATAHIKAIHLSEPGENEEKENTTGRPVLGERSHNSVVVPAQAIRHVQKDGKKPRAKRKAGAEQKRDAENVEEAPPVTPYGFVASAAKTERQVRRPHTTKKIPFQPTIHLEDEDQHGTPITPAYETKNIYTQHCKSLLDLSHHSLTCFETWSAQLSEHFLVAKIAEASFGEVYRLSLRETLPNFSRSDESVFKIIPLQAPPSTLPLDKRKRGTALRKQEGMSKPFDVANEVRLLQRMSPIPGFTNFRDVRIVQGRVAEAFSVAFKVWNSSQKAKKKEQSHFPDPSKKSSYSETQLWAVIEMQDAGTDLERLVESGECKQIWSVWDIFWQIALSLAKGEESVQFEHRDLHLGNICIRSSPSSAASLTPQEEDEIDPNRTLAFTTLETTIIDYTISRCTMSFNSSSQSALVTAYTDLSNPEHSTLFTGDSTDEYQYDIYRYMRSALYLDAPLQDSHTLRSAKLVATNRSWEQFHPQTNLVWLHLVLYKLLDQMVWPSTMTTKMTGARKAKGAKVAKKDRLVRAKCNRAKELEQVLLEVQTLLDPGQICSNGIRSAGDLIVWAMEQGWLRVGDVVGHEAGDESALVSQLEGLQL